MPLSDLYQVTAAVCSRFEAIAVPHAVGGSVASSAYGVPRATNDIDLVAALTLDNVDDFVSSLNHEFYVDAGAVREAVRRRGSFNLIHLAAMFKVDVFVPADDRISQSQLLRRVHIDLEGGGGNVLPLLSVEDVILQKLRRYDLGDRSSERQWSDIIGVLRTQFGVLDTPFVREMTSETGLEELFEQAIAEVVEA